MHNKFDKTGGTVNGSIDQKYKHTHIFGGWRMYGDSDTAFYLFPPDSTRGIGCGIFNDIWTLCPWTAGVLALGSPNHRWGQSYLTTSPNIQSDRNLKKDIIPLSDKYIDFFLLLQPVTYRFINGANGRIHIGFISQDVESAMFQVGLSDLDFAGFCRDEIDGTVIYSLRYEEFIALNTAVIQRQQQKITDLEMRLSKLENLNFA